MDPEFVTRLVEDGTAWVCTVTDVHADRVEVLVPELGEKIRGVIPVDRAFSRASRRHDHIWHKLSDGREFISRGQNLLALVTGPTDADDPVEELALDRLAACERQRKTLKEGTPETLYVTQTGHAWIYGRIRGGVLAACRREDSIKAVRHRLDCKPDISPGDALVGVLYGPEEGDDGGSFEYRLDVQQYFQDYMDGTVPAHRFATAKPAAADRRGSGPAPSTAKEAPVVLPETAYPEHTRHKAVLVVDDEPEACGLPECIHALEEAGYAVWRAVDEEQAQQHMAAHPEIDLLLVDLHFGKVDGTRVFARLCAEFGPVDCILMTIDPPGEVTLPSRRTLSEAVAATDHGPRVLDLWHKGAGLEGLATCLSSLGVGGERNATPEDGPFSPMPHTIAWALRETARTLESLPDDDPELVARSAVEAIMKRFGASHISGGVEVSEVAVLGLHPTSLKAKVLEASTEGAYTAFDHVLEHLHKSPLRDLVIDHEPISAPDVRQQTGKYFWFRRDPGSQREDGLDFSSIHGARCDARDADGYEYAVFAFGPRPGSLSEEVEALVREAAVLIGAALRVAAARQTVETQSDQALYGQALMGVAHELRQDIGLATRKAERLVHGIATPADHRALKNAVGDARDVLDELLGEVGHLALPETNLVDALREAVDYVNDMSPEEPEGHFILRLREPVPSDVWVRARPSQIRRIAGNLAGNANKLGLPLDPPGRELQIEVAMAPEGMPLPVRVLFHDVGPGLDAEAQRRAFDFGFSTTDGMGLGLTLCKAAARAMEGSFTIDWTARGAGATFRLALSPCQYSQGEQE